MTVFIYKSKKKPGEVVEGNIEADSEVSAARQLMRTGYYPIWIKKKNSLPKEGLQAVSFFPGRIKTRDLAVFTRQLSELLDSGLPLYDSLNIIESQIGLPNVKEIIIAVREGIKDGRTFSESLKSYPAAFPTLYINLVKSGEAAGSLSEVLANAADFLEKQEEVRSNIVVAMAYPMLMAAVGMLSVFILTFFVIPKLAGMFIEMGETLPLPTRILIGLSGFARRYWILAFLLAGGLFVFVKKSRSNNAVKKAIDGFKLRMPVFGRLVKSTELARFSRTLSMLLRNGVPILDALKITFDIMDNEIIREKMAHVYRDVKAGSSLAGAIKRSSSFPQLMVNMIEVGEKRGFLDRALLKVAGNYETEVDKAVKIMSRLLEPVVILIMGAVVGFIVIAMLLPVFQISLTAQ